MAKVNAHYPGYSPEEVRRKIKEESDPLQKLIDISNGKSIEGIPTPTPAQVYDSNVRLINKVIPDLRAIDPLDDGRDKDEEVSIETLERLSRVINGAAAEKASGPSSQS